MNVVVGQRGFSLICSRYSAYHRCSLPSSLQARGVAGRFTSPGLRKSLHFPLEAHTCGYQNTIWFSRSGFLVLFIAKSITLGDP